jgi:putative transcription factor
MELNCEICGSEIYGPSKRIILEGSKLLVCMKCSNLGEPDINAERYPSRTKRRTLGTPVKKRTSESRLPREVEELEVAEDFPKMIKEAREKKKMSQQDLARTVKERLSIIQKIELGKMTPDLRISRALEHILRIKLLLPRSETPIETDKPDQTGLTLGDVIQYKKR